MMFSVSTVIFYMKTGGYSVDNQQPEQQQKHNTYESAENIKLGCAAPAPEAAALLPVMCNKLNRSATRQMQTVQQHTAARLQR